MDNNYDIYVTGSRPLSLASDIQKFRWGRLHHPLPPRGTLVNSELILQLAANDLGESWNPIYCPWNWDANLPYNWCSEYNAWIIGKATGDRYIQNPEGNSTNTETMVDYFRRVSRYITAATYSWQDLMDNSNLIKPGYYTKINRSGHSTFFVHWCKSESDPTIVEFKNSGNSYKKYFMALGGNQQEKFGTTLGQGRIVALAIYSFNRRGPSGEGGVDPGNDRTWGEIVWEKDLQYTGKRQRGNDWEESLDGFGDTARFFQLTTTPPIREIEDVGDYYVEDLIRRIDYIDAIRGLTAKR
ncbi:MAG: hypothetical protein M5R36_29475 [Deltaproteobacteria bacterium]|nr:hypothetical protein [Deltaproteobacteria bacterium]